MDKLITSAGSTGAVDKPITSRNKTTDFLPRQNHQNLIPLKRRQSQQFPLCKKSVIFRNVNAPSLRNKAEVLVDRVIDKKIDVCAFPETWLRDEDTVALVALQGRYPPRTSALSRPHRPPRFATNKLSSNFN